MIVAFSGWNDAGEAATGATTHLLGALSDTALNNSAELIADFDSEEFYDFQVNRPHVKLHRDQSRSLDWPGARVLSLATPQFNHDFVIVEGVEPSMKWRTFSHQLLDLADDLEVSMVLTLGCMLADAPHTRPISVSGTGAHPSIATRLGVQVSSYEGPTGILGVIIDLCLRRGIDAISLWASLPHYASNSPSPKATLALINAIEDFLEIELPIGDLARDAAQWEREVSELAQEDSEISAYVKALEESKDTEELKDVSGEELAREAERFLRTQIDQGEK